MNFLKNNWKALSLIIGGFLICFYLPVGGGRFARIFIGMGEGYFAGTGATPSAEDIAANWAQIHSDEGYTIPDSIAAEMEALLKAFKG